MAERIGQLSHRYTDQQQGQPAYLLHRKITLGTIAIIRDNCYNSCELAAYSHVWQLIQRYYQASALLEAREIGRRL
jgi:hypothetical protein